MVVKSELKLIRSLQQKKKRAEYGRFVAEGVKMVRELLDSSLVADKVYATEPEILDGWEGPVIPVSEGELRKMSNLKTPNKVLAVFHIPDPVEIDETEWVLALDGVKDPGNLGTIIRLCDWFGIPQLLCTEDTVDCYNPKVLQATMGSIARVNIVYASLGQFLEQTKLPAFGAFMEGSPVQRVEFPEAGILVMGNEAHGVSSEISKMLTGRVSIPSYLTSGAESLNVATATAILLHEIRR